MILKSGFNGAYRLVIAFMAVIAVTAIHTSARAQAADFGQIVAFGDSLMDPGNAFALTGDVATPPFDPVPAAAYAIGGHHFTDGRTWVELLGQALGIQRSAGPAFQNSRVFGNYAIGGSRARVGSAGTPAQLQVAQFLATNGGHVPANALYIFGFGGNDVRDALQLGPLGGGPQVVSAAITAIADNLLALCTAGAQHIVVANVANLSTTPFAQAVGEPAITGARLLSAGLNSGVRSSVTAVLQPQCPGTRFYELDVFGLSTAIFSAPAAYGFVDMQPCLSFGQTANPICNNREQKFFWDAIHPTEAGHALLAAEALSLLASP